MYNWRKEGSIRPTQPTFSSKVTYFNNSKNSIISQLQIECLHSYASGLGKSFTFRMRFENEDSEIAFKFWDKVDEEQLRIYYLTENENKDTDVPLPYKQRIEVINIIEFIAQYEPEIDYTFVCELLTEMCFKRPDFYLITEVNKLVKDKKISEAIKFATELQFQNETYDICHEVIWSLALYLEKANPCPITKQELFSLYESIISENPNYKIAQSRLCELVLAQTPNNPDEAILLKEKAFTHALQADNQSSAKELLIELLGNSNAKLAIPAIKGDAGTLIELAKMIRNLNQKNEKLELELAKYNNDQDSKPRSMMWKTKPNVSDNNSETSNFSMQNQ